MASPFHAAMHLVVAGRLGPRLTRREQPLRAPLQSLGDLLAGIDHVPASSSSRDPRQDRVALPVAVRRDAVRGANSGASAPRSVSTSAAVQT